MILVETAEGCLLSLKVVPRSSRNQIVGVEQGVLKVKLLAPPVEGAANEALLEFLAKILKRPKTYLVLVSGFQSRNKKAKITGMKAAEILDILNQTTKGK